VDGVLHSDFVAGAAFADASGPRTGLAAGFLCTVTNAVTGALVATPLVTENPAGSGNYEATVNSTLLTSRIRLKVVFQNGTAELYSESIYDIGIMPIWSMVRSALRWDIEARLFDNDRVWQEITTAAGTTTTAVLGAMTIGMNDEYRGLWAWFMVGDNAQRERRVTGFDAATTTITFAPALPVPVDAGVTVELSPLRPSLINAAIDRAYRRLAGKALNPAEYRFATDGLTTEWSLDPSVYSIHNVGLIRDEDDAFLGWFQQSSWQVITPRTLRLAGPWNENSESPFDRPFYVSANAMDAGYHLRVMGHEMAAPPLYDSSAIVVDPDAVQAMALYDLSGMVPSRKDRLPLLRQDAEAALSRATSPWPAGSREVPN
jgi:hypothetical protein